MMPLRVVNADATGSQAAILDALPAHIALLDARGTIASVNKAWRQFGDANGLHSPGHQVGVDYLSVCDNALGADAPLAHRVAAGLRTVLQGTATRFSIEYPCHSPQQQRWFLMTATPLSADHPDGAVVMHVDVTAERRAETSLRISEARFREMAESIDEVLFLSDAGSGRVLYISPAYEDVWGRSCESMYADPESWAEAIHPDDLESTLEAYRKGMSVQSMFEYRIVRPNGSIRWIQSRRYPVRDDAGIIVRITGVAKDITERKQAEQELRESERRFSGMLETIELLAVMLDREARITYCNDYLLRLTGWRLDEVIGRDWFETYMPVEVDVMRPVFQALLANSPETWHRESAILTRTGARRLIRWNNSVLRSGTGEVIGTASIGEDITERKQSEIRIKHLNRVQAVLSGINALIVRARDRDELYREACQIAVDAGGFRMSMISILDKDAQRIVPVASAGKDEDLMALVRELLASSDRAQNSLVAQAIRDSKAIVANDSQNDPRVLLGAKYAEAGVRSLAVLPLMVADEAVGVLVLYASEVAFFHDEEMELLTELTGDIAFAIDHIGKAERLDYLACYDSTTGFANQSLFLQRLQEKLLSAQDDEHKKAVFVLDIERFKTVNDAFGRNVGDELLRQIAERLVQAGGGDASRFARLGADRFAIVATGMDSVEQVGRYTEQRLDATFRAPFRVGDHDLRIFVKVGIALFPDDGMDADALLRNAEAALKKAKTTGERYLFFTQKMTERVAERLSLENRLRQALDKDEFVLHYQPKVSFSNGLLTGCEALIRWNDPQTGLVPPMQFIPILEETGLIHEVGRWALRKAIEDYLRWRNADLAAVRIAVNVSPLQLRNRGFIAEIKDALGVDAHAATGLELEITESLIMEDVKHSIASLHAIRATGVTIAIDDFGTGFSSLSYLSKLPVDTLKIDRSFIIDMTGAPEGLSLVSTIINLSHSLNLKVVAEGVETEEQSRLLRLLRCDEMQGYLFSKPVPADIFETKFLARNAASS